ncbi:SHOCT domain-containing protein [Natrinema sp. LN54]|uniref:SHOCT domain-containing protein n=1 Tax=Natrinema sp. LN54 TaxID=3458705 RepID=UPI004036EEE1
MDVDELVEHAKGDSVTKAVLEDSGTVKTGLIAKSSYSSIVSHLDEGEQPHFVQRYEHPDLQLSWNPDDRPRYKKGHMRTTVVTDRRIFYYSTDNSFSVPYTNISEVEDDGTTLKVTQSGGRTVEFIFLAGTEGEDAVEYVRKRMHEIQAGETSQAAASTTADRLEELKQMHDQDLITEAEFEEKKAEILEEL